MEVDLTGIGVHVERVRRAAQRDVADVAACRDVRVDADGLDVAHVGAQVERHRVALERRGKHEHQLGAASAEPRPPQLGHAELAHVRQGDVQRVAAHVVVELESLTRVALTKGQLATADIAVLRR